MATSDKYIHPISAGDLPDTLIGQLISFDGDDPTVYGGQRPDPNRDDWIIITLNGREHRAIPEDYVYLDRPL